MTDEARARRWAAVYAERERLLRIARRRTLNAAEAEDCVSEAMLRCVEFADLDEERLAAFLTTVTVRLCADQHRARTRLARAGGRLADRDDEPSAEDSVCDRAEAAWLAEQVNLLPLRQRKVVEARAAGLSCADVASRLDVSVDAVKSAVARARTTVRAALASSCGLIPAVLGRYRLAASLAAGGAVAGVTVGGLLFVVPEPPSFAAPVPARPPAVAPAERPVERVVAVPAAPAAVAPRRLAPPPRQVSVAPPPAVPRPASAVAEPAPPGPVPLAVEPSRTGHNYSLVQRLGHCVDEGVEVSPTIRCRMPQGVDR